MRKVERFSVFHQNHQMTQTESPVEYAPTTAKSAKGRRVSAVWYSTKAIDLFEWAEQVRMVYFNGITIHFQPIASLGGSVPDVLAQAIQNTPTTRDQKKVTQILQFFTELVA